MIAERDLRHALAGADAASPPPVAAAPITAATLLARLRRRRRRQALVATAAVALAAIATAVLRGPSRTVAAPAQALAELRAELRMQLDALQARLAALDDLAPALADLQRRGDLAALRADAAIEHFPIAYQTFDAAAAAQMRARTAALHAGTTGHEDHR